MQLRWNIKTSSNNSTSKMPSNDSLDEPNDEPARQKTKLILAFEISLW